MTENVENKHEAFAREWYHNGRNGTKAYKAVYSDELEDSVAAAGASRMLSYAKVKSVIQELEKETQFRHGITFDRIVDELKSIAFNDITEMMNDKGEVHEFVHMDPAVRRTISELQVTSRSAPDSDYVEKQTKLKVYDKLKAIDKLCHLFGLDKPKQVDLSGIQFVMPPKEEKE